MEVSWDRILWGHCLSCGNILTGVMRPTKHLVLDQNCPIYPRTSIVQNYIPGLKALLQFPPLTTSLTIWEGSCRATFHLCKQWCNDVMVAGTESEWAGCVFSCLPLFVSQYFWLITLPSFPLSSCQTTRPFLYWGAPPPPVLSTNSPLHFLQLASAAHTSALCANHAN